MNKSTHILAPCLGILIGSALPISGAVTFNSHSFDLGVTGTDLEISTSGRLDWGYLTSDFLGGDDVQTPTNFDSMTAAQGGSTVSFGSSAIGSVFVHEDADSNPTTSAPFTGFTFGGVEADGVAGGIGGSEEIFTITFQDLGVGQREISLYLGHSNTGRTFDADVYLGGDLSGAGTADQTLNSGGIGSQAFIYTLEVNTTDALDDVSISIDSASGGSGGFQFSGYTVTAIPEPSSLTLLGLGSLSILLRRRR